MAGSTINLIHDVISSSKVFRNTLSSALVNPKSSKNWPRRFLPTIVVLSSTGVAIVVAVDVKFARGIEIDVVSVREPGHSWTVDGWICDKGLDETGHTFAEESTTVAEEALIDAEVWVFSGNTKTESSGADTRRTSRLASKQKLALIESSEMDAARSAGSQRSRWARTSATLFRREPPGLRKYNKVCLKKFSIIN